MNAAKFSLLAAAATAVLSVGALTLTARPASAYVVCDRDGDDCWHTDHRYHGHFGVGFRYHPDEWYFHHDWDHDRDRHWHHHHDGRGYWRNGLWVTF